MANTFTHFSFGDREKRLLGFDGSPGRAEYEHSKAAKTEKTGDLPLEHQLELGVIKSTSEVAGNAKGREERADNKLSSHANRLASGTGNDAAKNKSQVSLFDNLPSAKQVVNFLDKTAGKYVRDKIQVAGTFASGVIEGLSKGKGAVNTPPNVPNNNQPPEAPANQQRPGQAAETEALGAKLREEAKAPAGNKESGNDNVRAAVESSPDALVARIKEKLQGRPDLLRRLSELQTGLLSIKDRGVPAFKNAMDNAKNFLIGLTAPQLTEQQQREAVVRINPMESVIRTMSDQEVIDLMGKINGAPASSPDSTTTAPRENAPANPETQAVGKAFEELMSANTMPKVMEALGKLILATVNMFRPKAEAAAQKPSEKDATKGPDKPMSDAEKKNTDLDKKIADRKAEVGRIDMGIKRVDQNIADTEKSIDYWKNQKKDYETQLTALDANNPAQAKLVESYKKLIAIADGGITENQKFLERFKEIKKNLENIKAEASKELEALQKEKQKATEQGTEIAGLLAGLSPELLKLMGNVEVTKDGVKFGAPEGLLHALLGVKPGEVMPFGKVLEKVGGFFGIKEPGKLLETVLKNPTAFKIVREILMTTLPAELKEKLELGQLYHKAKKGDNAALQKLKDWYINKSGKAQWYEKIGHAMLPSSMTDGVALNAASTFYNKEVDAFVEQSGLPKNVLQAIMLDDPSLIQSKSEDQTPEKKSDGAVASSGVDTMSQALERGAKWTAEQMQAAMRWSAEQWQNFAKNLPSMNVDTLTTLMGPTAFNTMLQSLPTLVKVKGMLYNAADSAQRQAIKAALESGHLTPQRVLYAIRALQAVGENVDYLKKQVTSSISKAGSFVWQSATNGINFGRGLLSKIGINL